MDQLRGQKGSKEAMNDKQLELILEIVQEQLSEYLDDELAGAIYYGIAEGLNDNLPLLEDLGAIR